MIGFFRRVSRYFFRNYKRAVTFALNYPRYAMVSKRRADASLIFIVGAPRTGSTILYQALSNCYSVRYIDNLAASWHRNLPFGMWLSNKEFGLCPHDNYSALHGNTKDFGWHAPSECGEFWYRWLPKEDHFVDSRAISPKIVDQIRRELSEIHGLFGLPLLFKNLNMGQRLRLIKEFAPDAKIIFIRRDPRFVVRSLIEARKKASVKENQWWSVKPKNFRELSALPEPEMCAAQVFYIEEQIKQDLCLFPECNVKTIQYNDLSATTLDSLAEWAALDKKDAAMPPQFTTDKPLSLSENELESLNVLVGRYRFDKEVFC